MSSGGGDVELYERKSKFIGDVSIAVDVRTVDKIIAPTHQILAH